MEKLYLLLRDNRQSGPHSREELLQMNLRSFDLVWEEGLSQAWRYPAEIQSLQSLFHQPAGGQRIQEAPLFDATFSEPRPARAKVFVSTPRQKAAVPVQPTPAPVAATPTPQPTTYDVPPSGSSSSRTTTTDEHINTTRQETENKEERRSNQPSTTRLPSGRTTALVLLCLAGAATIYFLMPAKDSKKESAAIQPAANPVQNTGSTALELLNDTKMAVAEQPETEQSMKGKEKAQKPLIKSISEKTVHLPVKTSEPVQEPINTFVATPPVTDNASTTGEEAAESTEGSTAEEKKKKAKLRDRIKGWIEDKREKKEAQTDETDSEPPSANDRKAVRRSNDNSVMDVSTAAANVMVSVDGGESNMMGIQGMNGSLRNRNRFALESAGVLCSYFDEGGKLLETKTITVSGIKSNSTKGFKIPNHRWAARVEVSLQALNETSVQQKSF